MEAAYIPEVNDDLDTQNFEKFDEVFILNPFLHFPKLYIFLGIFMYFNFVYI